MSHCLRVVHDPGAIEPAPCGAVEVRINGWPAHILAWRSGDLAGAPPADSREILPGLRVTLRAARQDDPFPNFDSLLTGDAPLPARFGHDRAAPSHL